MAIIAKIKRMYFREKLSVSEIGRRTSLSRNTIKKWLKEPGAEPKYRRNRTDGKLSQFESKLRLSLEADTHRPKRDRRTALMLFEAIRKEGFEGSYSRVTAFVRHWRGQSAKLGLSAFVPLKFEMGDAFQFDWSEEWLMIGGIHRKILASHLKLCASRAFLVAAYPTQSHEMLFDAHTRAFTALGGIPRRGIYDNMKTAVDRVCKGGGRIVNARFFAMTAHYLFDPDFCNVASGWEKGIVEKNVQDTRRRVWIDAKQQRFAHFDELNVWLEARCKALWTELPHPEYAKLTIADVLEHEQIHLMPMVSPFDGYVEVLARVSSTCLISVQRNRYSVPCQLAHQMLSAHLYPDRIEVYAENVRIARHVRLMDRDQIRYDWQHYIPLIERKPGALRNGAPFADMPQPLVTLQSALLRREHGDRVMAKVLAAVPTQGLEAVLVAVELVLESGVPSAEHVMNVLARLRQAPPPAQVETCLKLNVEPLADTERYDSLSIKETPHA